MMEKRPNETGFSEKERFGGRSAGAALPLSFFLAVITFFFQNTRIEVATPLNDGAASLLLDFVYRLGTVGSKLAPETSLLALVFAAALYFTFQKGKWRFSWSALCLSLLFGISNVLGLSVHTMGSFWYLSANCFQWFLSLCRILSTSFIVYVALLWLYCFFDRRQAEVGGGLLDSRRNRLLRWAHRHGSLVCFGAILLCWLPYCIVFYPGGFLIDSYIQLLTAFRMMPVTSKSPIYHTYFFGGLFRLGRAIFHSDNAGLYLYNIVQAVICAGCYAHALVTIRRMKLNRWFFYGTFFFFALTPIVSTFSLTVLKDPLFAAFTVLLVSQTIRMLQAGREKHPYRTAVKYMLWAVLFGLCRNGALYLLIPLAIVWALIGWKKRKTTDASAKAVPFAPCGGLLAAVLCLWVMTHAMLPVLGVQPGTKADMLSLPFQQTARYVRYHSNEVTEDEKAAIDTVLRYDELRSAYTADFADPVISLYRLDGESGEAAAMWNYVKVWVKMGLKHPKVYLEATVANAYPFFTFYPKYDAGGIIYLYIDNAVQQNDAFDLFMPEQLSEARQLLSDLTVSFASVPVLNAVNDPAVYTWLLLAGIAYLLHKRQYRRLTAFAVPLLILLACIAAPVAHLRYLLPVCAVVPLLLAYCAATPAHGKQVPKGM